MRTHEKVHASTLTKISAKQRDVQRNTVVNYKGVGENLKSTFGIIAYYINVYP